MTTLALAQDQQADAARQQRPCLRLGNANETQVQGIRVELVQHQTEGASVQITSKLITHQKQNPLHLERQGECAQTSPTINLDASPLSSEAVNIAFFNCPS